MSQETPQKIIYPDQLNITINTSIPGYQKIEYKPYMTIKDIDDRRVHFNPLVKLKKSTIDSIDNNIRTKKYNQLLKAISNDINRTPTAEELKYTKAYFYQTVYSNEEDPIN